MLAVEQRQRCRADSITAGFEYQLYDLLLIL